MAESRQVEPSEPDVTAEIQHSQGWIGRAASDLQVRQLC